MIAPKVREWLPWAVGIFSIAALVLGMGTAYGSLAARVTTLEKEENRIYDTLKKIDQQTKDIPAIKALLEQHLRDSKRDSK